MSDRRRRKRCSLTWWKRSAMSIDFFTLVRWRRHGLSWAFISMRWFFSGPWRRRLLLWWFGKSTPVIHSYSERRWLWLLRSMSNPLATLIFWKNSIMPRFVLERGHQFQQHRQIVLSGRSAISFWIVYSSLNAANSPIKIVDNHQQNCQ